MTDESANADFHVTYRGREVYFCCDRCIERFQNNPERYLSRLPQFAGEDDPVRGPADSHAPAAGAIEGTAGRPAAGGGVPEKTGGSPAGAGTHDAVPLLGRLHPVVVHFPIVATPLALLSFLAWRVTGRASLAAADVLPLAVGGAAALVAVLTGNIAHDHVRFNERLTSYVSWHQAVSITAMSLTVAACVVRGLGWRSFRGVWPILYLGLLALSSACLAVTGYLGGSLVFGVDHLRW